MNSRFVCFLFATTPTTHTDEITQQKPNVPIIITGIKRLRHFKIVRREVVGDTKILPQKPDIEAPELCYYTRLTNDGPSVAPH